MTSPVLSCNGRKISRATGSVPRSRSSLSTGSCRRAVPMWHVSRRSAAIMAPIYTLGCHMATIRQDDFIDSVADALQFISYYHPVDYIRAMGEAYTREESPAA